VTRLVFGRTEYVQPLEHVGEAADGDDLLAAFPGEWVELVAIPEADVCWIVRDGKEVEGERAFARARA
jgi:hypothetical protein